MGFFTRILSILGGLTLTGGVLTTTLRVSAITGLIIAMNYFAPTLPEEVVYGIMWILDKLQFLSLIIPLGVLRQILIAVMVFYGVIFTWDAANWVMKKTSGDSAQ